MNVISLITTLKNRAHLLQYGVAGVLLQDFWQLNPDIKLEINVGDSGSTDGLDDLLQDISTSPIVKKVRKYTIDRSKSVYVHPFNCPAEEYNILVKLATSDIILKIDPEAVLLTPSFLTKAQKIIQERSAIVMPFPYFMNDCSFNNIESLIQQWQTGNHYATHITKENCGDRNIYYLALFKRTDFLALGGVDERFIASIGYEDDHFLQQYRRRYGYETTITLQDEAVAHLWHGRTTVAPELNQFVEQNVQLGKLLRNTWPNEGREWGRRYDHIELTEWAKGERI